MSWVSILRALEDSLNNYGSSARACFRYVTNSTYLPGQGPSSHAVVSDISPVQNAPPFCGSGLVHVLIRVLVPDAHDTEHVAQVPQSANSPSTGEGNGWDNICIRSSVYF